MSVRPPTSTLDRTAVKKPTHLTRLSSFTAGDSERKTPLGHQREPLSDLPPEGAVPGLVQRCVVVERDTLGFGFTVCGERIKLVQNVRPGGAAVKAGVHEGDRIIKVNGALVSSMSHQEVVKMIKSGMYVALTLQGPPPSVASVPLQPLTSDVLPNHRIALGGEAPPPPPPPLPPTGIGTPTQRITGPKPLQDPEVQKHATQILRKMLEQEEAELQDLLDERSQNPSPSLEERIESAKRRAHKVRVRIQQDLDGTRSESVSGYVMAGEGRLSIDSGEGEFDVCESPVSSPSSLFRTPLRHRHSSDPQAADSGGKAQIIGPEEEEEEDDCYTINEMDGPFQDIELLKSRPAHMAVFMRYIFSQLRDPNPLLFYLSVEAYLGSSPKDARTLAPQICSDFLNPDAPLKIKVRDEYLSDIESRLHAQEDIRGPLSELQQQVLPEIQLQIQDYRSKQLMGLGSLFGESDLQQLDGDPAKERQVVDRQVAALWELLSKHEEERSSPLSSAVHLYLRHTGIKLRDSKVFPGLSTEKEKWLAFLPKTLKPLSGMKKENHGEEKKRNPILKYIGKPRSSSQSMRKCEEHYSGNVRNIIQHFENHTDPVGEEGENEGQRLSTGSLGEDSMESPTVLVRLARSESLKAQGEGRRRGGAAGAETVPRSRSDVDMEDCDERDGTGLRPLHHSASSSASSSSARSLENPTPPYTPRSRRRSVDTPLALLPDAPLLEEDVVDTQNWQDTVEPDVLSSLSAREIDRQAVIYELFTTEASHLRILRVLDQVFFQKMRNALSSEELSCIFPNLPQVYNLHASLCESMKRLRDSPIVQGIGDIMLSRFEDAPGEEFQEEVSHLCSQQSQALELIKNKQRKDPRFAHLIQECEASPHCRRLQLKDLLVSEMQRLTKYPLLLDNIIKHTEAGSPDLQPLLRAQVCCRGILQAVNEVVRETEHRQRLSQYQRRLDLSPLERLANPVSEFKNLDLTTKKMIHEGPLTWKVSKDKAIDIQALLLSDLLLLLQRGPDDRLILRYPSRTLGGVVGGVVGGNTDLKTPFCPVVRLGSSLVRSVATDNKALYVISTSERQMYELVAGTLSEKNTWKDLLEKTISLASGGVGTTKQGSPAPSRGDVRSSQLHGNHVSRLDDSPMEEAGSLEKDSQSDDENVLTPTTPADQSEAFMRNDGQDYVGEQVAEAALQDVETLRRLIFKDHDGWSQDSDDTPTNETANEGSPFIDRSGLEAAESTSDETSTQLEEDHVDAPPVEVVRKAVGAGSSSIPDDMIDVTSNQSSESKGNMFYLVLPKDQTSLLTEESSTDDSSDLEAARQEQKVTSLSSQQEDEEQEMSFRSPRGQSHLEVMSNETRPSQSRANIQRHIIKNMDEIFQTIEDLMKKLHQLRDIEADHCRLLRMERRKSPVGQGPEVSIHRSPSFIRMPSEDLGSADGNEGGPTEPAQPLIHSTGF
ncbi:rho guanine nucleotide exchange factor 11 isoform X2 [Brachyhypopomus gauderio]|uniref:rho guanine nucleotide exchange factor 11 isoform X2 n=1 Tax=Brachyhypopomus gauderio TaxID=698409 RepID=UPI0040430A74